MGLFHKNTHKPVKDDIKTAFKNPEKISEIILGAINDAVVLIDADGTTRAFNPAAASVTGWQMDDAVELHYSSIIQLLDENGAPITAGNDPITIAFQAKKAQKSTIMSIAQKDGTKRAVDISVAPLLSDDGTMNAAILIMRDITDIRREEKKRADFISTASHEMRTPVAAIEGYLELATNKNVCTIDEKAESYLNKALASTKHLGNLFQDLLTSAKAEDGRLTNNPEIIEMTEFTQKLIEDLRFSAEKKGLNLKLTLGSDPNGLAPLYYIEADPDRIREVITNIFDNAVKYTESGAVTIGLTGDKNVMQFFIKDTGPGIPPNDIPHLFQKFYRVDNSTTRTIGGTGLGLFICRKIIELYKGRIWVESDGVKGSTFYINIPRIDAAAAQKRLKEQADELTAPPVANSVQTK